MNGDLQGSEGRRLRKEVGKREAVEGSARASRVRVGNESLHVALGGRDRREAELRVERVRVARDELEATEALQVGVRVDRLHEARGDAEPAVRLEHEDVGEVAERGAVGDDAGEADLTRAFERAEADRVAQRALDDVARDAARP